MQVHVGPFAYAVQLTHDPIFDESGDLCDGVCDFHRQQIRIRADLPPQQQVYVLMHELRHAWAYHWPHTRDDEEAECDLVGQMIVQLLRDLQPWARAGKTDATAEALCGAVGPLMTVMTRKGPNDGGSGLASAGQGGREPRVAPLDTVSPTECAPNPSAQRVQCQRCEKVYSAGVVVQGPPAWAEDHGCHLVRRSVYCDHCHHVQHWVESSTADGLATGQVIQPPTFSVGPTAERFLREFPHAAGVTDV